MAVTIFPCQKVEFPIKYLGLPLSTSKLPRSTFQPPADRIVDKLPSWKDRMLQCSGCLTLIKTTLCAVLVYTSMSIVVPKWLIKVIKKILTAFLWSGSEMLQNGKSSVAWSRVQRPLHLGELRIMDLKLLGIVLRARWLWLHHSDPGHSWAALLPNEEAPTVAFFNVSIQMMLGNRETLFLD
jgi:hypothetical protein